MSEEWKAQDNEIRLTLVFGGVDVQENPGETPEARSRLCVLSGFLPRDLCHRRDSSHRLLAHVLTFLVIMREESSRQYK